MRAKFKICKNDGVLYEGIYDIFDAESLGGACTHAWNQLRDQRLAKTTNVGSPCSMRLTNDCSITLLCDASLIRIKRQSEPPRYY